ncbi:hypothetical protein ScPMuIL_005442 [Solemya velum]
MFGLPKEVTVEEPMRLSKTSVTTISLPSINKTWHFHPKEDKISSINIRRLKMPEGKLRFITYLSPGLPVKFFEILMHYLEEVTGRETYLIYESRWSGPPTDRKDPFTLDEVDIGFMCSSGFLRLVEEKNNFVELCPAGASHVHPKNDKRPIYFSDVIIHADDKAKYREFYDLRGHKWAYNDDLSLSGNLVVLSELKKMGHNASFFSTIKQTGSHLNSIQEVLDKSVDAAAVDSNTLRAYFREHPENKTKLSVMLSFGPLPVYPIVFNSRLPADVKEKITTALLKMVESPEWKSELESVGVHSFMSIDMSLYNLEAGINELVKGLSIKTVYY